LIHFYKRLFTDMLKKVSGLRVGSIINFS